MRFTISLDLRHLIHRLEPCPCLGISTRQSAPFKVDESEHAPIGEIAVMRDCEDLTAGLVLV